MGWININDRMPPEGLHVLLEVSGWCASGYGLVCDHSVKLGCWIIPQGEDEVEWLIDTDNEILSPEVHAWMPLPKHYQPPKMFEPFEDNMEHSIIRDDPDWIYKGEYVYEQMSLEDFMKEVENGTADHI